MIANEVRSAPACTVLYCCSHVQKHVVGRRSDAFTYVSIPPLLAVSERLNADMFGRLREDDLHAKNPVLAAGASYAQVKQDFDIDAFVDVAPVAPVMPKESGLDMLAHVSVRTWIHHLHAHNVKQVGIISFSIAAITVHPLHSRSASNCIAISRRRCTFCVSCSISFAEQCSRVQCGSACGRPSRRL